MSGTVAAVVSLLVRAIVIGWLAGLAIETVPVVASAPAASLTVCLGERQAERRDVVVDHDGAVGTGQEAAGGGRDRRRLVAVDLLVVDHRDRERGRGRTRRDRHGRRDRQLVDLVAQERNRQCGRQSGRCA